MKNIEAPRLVEAAPGVFVEVPENFIIKNGVPMPPPDQSWYRGKKFNSLLPFNEIGKAVGAVVLAGAVLWSATHVVSAENAPQGDVHLIHSTGDINSTLTPAVIE